MPLNHCPNFDFIVFRRIPAGVVQVTRLRCKKWSCEYCAKLNREMWRSHLKKRIGRMGGDWWFITVTAAEWARERSKSLATLRRGLDLLFKRIRRVFGKVEYVRVFELHEKGAFHAHIIMSGLAEWVCWCNARSGEKTFQPVTGRTRHCWAVRSWFKKTAVACGMGYMVDVQRVGTIAQVVNYISKYMTKEAQKFDEKGLRRIQASQGIGAANARSTAHGWQAVKYLYASDADGSPVYDMNLKLTINPSWWRENYTYPPSAQART